MQTRLQLYTTTHPPSPSPSSIDVARERLSRPNCSDSTSFDSITDSSISSSLTTIEGVGDGASGASSNTSGESGESVRSMMTGLRATGVDGDCNPAERQSTLQVLEASAYH